MLDMNEACHTDNLLIMYSVVVRSVHVRPGVGVGPLLHICKGFSSSVSRHTDIATITLLPLPVIFRYENHVTSNVIYVCV